MASGVLNWMAWAVIALANLPVLVVCLQVVMAWPRRAGVAPGAANRALNVGGEGAATVSFVVLVPAHNEEAVIAETVRQLKQQLCATDTLLVVADNCTDATARLAAQAGASVIERTDATRRGKGYALDHGLRHLAPTPHDALIVVDADCSVTPVTGLRELAKVATNTRRPVQCLDLMNAEAGSGVKTRVAAFAWRLKNWVRPLGWQRMGWPCQLMGTGMAFPWAMAQNMALANAELVEDMKLGVDISLAGAPPLFFPGVLVESTFPTSAKATQGQRKRWEHGHLSIIVSQAPRLLGRALRRRDMALLAMALDLAVPPLALLTLMQLGSLVLALVMAAFGLGWGATLLTLACLVGFATAIGLAWWGWGRAVVSARDLLSVPWYVLSKVPLYVGYLIRRQKEWVRTDRK